ncbi:hypothetical protein BDB00DRAFT_788407 [Zychaea mexicana]|uniref:uncharacterized protein n=1 Tax=Zychaea mexicana TaxID=64656 RepID=UPI0022FE4DB2|nr:uncharacterized protein BDB00DRAFT_788407 [Zychaea mexicana]KAI9492928.1 hypothetical protein BDB00DRAFT_788407 [Zychaea mexicana]
MWHKGNKTTQTPAFFVNESVNSEILRTALRELANEPLQVEGASSPARKPLPMATCKRTLKLSLLDTSLWPDGAAKSAKAIGEKLNGASRLIQLSNNVGKPVLLLPTCFGVYALGRVTVTGVFKERILFEHVQDWLSISILKCSITSIDALEEAAEVPDRVQSRLQTFNAASA